MLDWLNDANRAELLLFYEFWKSLQPWQRRLYAGIKICLIAPCDMVRRLPHACTRKTVVEVERELAAIVKAWREAYASCLGVVNPDDEFVRKSVLVEYSFIALLRDLTHGGGGDWNLKVPGWKIGRLALNLELLEQLVPMWLEEHKPNNPPVTKRRFSLVFGKRA